MLSFTQQFNNHHNSIQGTPQQMYLNYFTPCLNPSNIIIITKHTEKKKNIRFEGIYQQPKIMAFCNQA
jgi:hypothetical protein